MFIESPLKYVVSLSFFFFRIPQKSTDAFEHKVTGFLESLYHFVGFGISFSEELPYNFSSDPGPKNLLCPCENFIA